VADVLACVDNSSYANGVCDHAGWFASDPDVGVEVLHVVEGSPGNGTQSLIDDAVSRVREQGVGPITSAKVEGTFLEVASQWDADIIVMGKRGDDSAADRERLGANIDPMVRATETPVCLTPKVFLPIHRALILLDADITHRRAVEFVKSQARLAGLTMDALIVAGRMTTLTPRWTGSSKPSAQRAARYPRSRPNASTSRSPVICNPTPPTW
jgi:nucleotide-binding universal stress UspA family protein